jgi:hypothetical protein
VLVVVLVSRSIASMVFDACIGERGRVSIVNIIASSSKSPSV